MQLIIQWPDSSMRLCEDKINNEHKHSLQGVHFRLAQLKEKQTTYYLYAARMQRLTQSINWPESKSATEDQLD
jgi:hypothetical protein